MDRCYQRIGIGDRITSKKEVRWVHWRAAFLCYLRTLASKVSQVFINQDREAALVCTAHRTCSPLPPMMQATYLTWECRTLQSIKSTPDWTT
jgi:hypothetical protein